MANPPIHKVQSMGMEFAKLCEQVDLDSYDEKEFDSFMQVIDRVSDTLEEIHEAVEDKNEGAEDEAF